MDKICFELKNKQNIRTNLSELRKLIKDEKKQKELYSIVEKEDALWLSFLLEEDAKTRKNAALLLGDLVYQPALLALWEAYLKESTRFVNSAYLTALGALNVNSILPDLRERLELLTDEEVTEENRKHHAEELKELRKIVIAHDGIEHHSFVIMEEEAFLLVTNQIHRTVVEKQVQEVDPTAKTKVHPFGVMVRTKEFAKVAGIRTYREMLFPFKSGVILSREPRAAAKELWDSGLCKRVSMLHKGDGAHYYRLELKGDSTLEERSNFAKQFAMELEQQSGGCFVNSKEDYELEIRLVPNKEGALVPFLKSYLWKDKRFAYRKNAIATSIQPSTAALMMELAKPYLKEKAQIMDPFCGVGTMLVERSLCVQAKEFYATEIFGDAIGYAKENVAKLKLPINFIHRDFFDFTHNYPFDEFVTNMPVKGKKTKDELDDFYAKFFAKTIALSSKDAMIVMYTNELGFVKKQIRLHKELRMLQETLMQKKGEYYLLVIAIHK